MTVVIQISIVSPLYVICLENFLDYFKIFYISWVQLFDYDVLKSFLCLFCFYLSLFYLGLLRSWVWKFMYFTKFGMFSAVISSCIFLPICFSFSGNPVMRMLDILKLSSISKTLFIVSVFFLSCLYRNNLLICLSVHLLFISVIFIFAFEPTKEILKCLILYFSIFSF